MSIFDVFFTDDTGVDVHELYGKAQKYLAWATDSECQKFLERLDVEAARPLKIGEQTALVEGAVRANTLREVASWLRQGIKSAQSDITDCERELRDVRTER